MTAQNWGKVKRHTVVVQILVGAAVPTGAVALALVVDAVDIADLGSGVPASCIPLQRNIIHSQLLCIGSITHPMMVSIFLVFDHLESITHGSNALLMI